MNGFPTFAQKEFRTTVRFDDPVVRDHRVHGVRIMPGVTFLDLFYRAAQAAGFEADRLELRSILFTEPLALAEDFEQEVTIEIRAAATHWMAEARGRSRRIGSDAFVSGWQAHAKAEFYAVERIRPAKLDMPQRPGRSQTRDLDELYSALRSADIQHRAFMKPEGRVIEDGSGVLAEVELSVEAEEYAEHFMMHPAFLDYATGVSFFANYSQARYQGTPFIPLFIEKFRAFSPLGRRCFIRVANRAGIEKDGEDIGRDEEILIYNEAGDLAAFFENLTFKKVRSPESIRDLLQRNASPKPPESSKGAAAAKLESVARDSGVSVRERIIAELRGMLAEAQNCPADEVDTQCGFYDLGLDSSDLLKIGNKLQVRVGQYLYPTLLFEYPNVEALAGYMAEHHAAAFAADQGQTSAAPGAPRGKLELTALRFAWKKVNSSGVEPGPAVLVAGANTPQFEAVRQAAAAAGVQAFTVSSGPRFRRSGPFSFDVRNQTRADFLEVLRQMRAEECEPELVLCFPEPTVGSSGTQSSIQNLLALTQALLDSRPARPVRLISIGESGQLVWAHAAAGFSATVRRETPVIHAAALYCEGPFDHESASRLLREAGDHPFLRWTRSETYRWSAMPLPAGGSAPQVVVKDSTIFITGGAGGIGLLLAEHLCSRGARVALAGRSELSGEAKARIEKLRSTGAGVIYLRADVSEKDQLAQALQQAREALGAVRGVIHAAGNIRDSLIPALTSHAAEEVMAAKIRGTELLDELTRTDALDFFALFSSLSSFAGNAGQAIYTAANGFLNGFAEQREILRERGERQGRTVSILWPLWAAGGMHTTPEAAASLFNETGMAALDSTQGVQCFDELLASAENSVTMIAGDRAKLEVFLGVETAATPSSMLPPVAKQTAEPVYREQDIAIVGVSGRYPLAADLDEFWANLASGRDCISEIPSNRWDHTKYFDPKRGTPGKCYSRWGGFLSDVDRFDPVFFNISPREAELMDPQERLFLETVWHSLEDAGYSKSALASEPIQHRVGVFAGVMWGGYQLFGAEELLKGNVVTANSPYWSIANRVSYFFNLNGPSMAVDSACSSSLLAIHLASESLRRGECRMAIAGGVNLSLHPAKYLLLSQMGMLSTHGRCKTFSADGDGYVPGEGVGAVVLKPARDAVRDGDTIHAIIRGSAVNHDGGGNGFTVPNPSAQAAVIQSALAAADIHPRTISYLEAHGTGTSLGDPVEIAGLTRAWAKQTPERHFCAIGSVKSAIGHLEAAAGISAVTKVLLQFRHGRICPAQHAEQLNPKIDFAGSPFFVQRELAEWKRPTLEESAIQREVPRRAGISSFGAGGANVHLILEEPAAGGMANPPGRIVPLFLLSAQNPERLNALAEKFRDRLKDSPYAFQDMLFTLQNGREPLAERLAIRAATTAEAIEGLKRFLAGEAAENVFTGKAARNAGDTRELAEAVEGWNHRNGGEKSAVALFAQLWVRGHRMDWKGLCSGAFRRVSLPGYPFSGKRFWLPRVEVQAFTQANQPDCAVAQDRPEACADVSLLRPVWRSKQPATGGFTGRILVSGANAEVQNALMECLTACSLQFAGPGELPGILEAAGTRPDAVVHLLRGNTDAQAELRGLYDLGRAVLKGIKRGNIRLIVAGEHGEGGNAVLDAASAFLKSLALEQPRLSATCLRLSSVRADRAAGSIAAELSQSDADVLLRPEGRLAQSWESLPEHATFQNPFRRHGVYLITGGTGAIGLHVARWLARKYQARLVLLGRSELPRDVDPNRQMSESARQKLPAIAELRQLGAEVLYLRADTADRDQLASALSAARDQFGAIQGIIHCAGVAHDGFLSGKSWDDFASVLAPKIAGTENLDELTRDDALDFFALFGSTSSATGNLGQCDYSAANGFMNGFAVRRENARARGQRKGRTVCLSWPLWAEGGMEAGELVQKTLQARGIRALTTEDALAVFERSLSSAEPRILVWSGNPETFLQADRPAAARQTAPLPGPSALPQTPELETYLESVLARVTKLTAAEIDRDAEFAEYGVDSIALNEILQTVNRDLGDVLDPFAALEHNTIRALASYLSRLGVQRQPANAAAAQPAIQEQSAARGVSAVSASEPVAVIGMAARFPGADSLDLFWDNLKNGITSIREVPRDRWAAEEYFSAVNSLKPGQTYSKWGGFLDDIDLFDPGFFNMTEAQARVADPLHRLMLETSVRAFEDAGYDAERLGRGLGGIFLGAKQGEYAELAGTEALLKADPASAWKFNSACMITSRLAEYFNLQGPACLVDTACSSSLVAVHLACESLRRGECDFAIAGGVELLLTPKVFIHFSHSRSLATDGQCKPFESGAGGTVLGEGCGVVILKPLSRALADGDHIYAVVEGSAVNSSGAAGSASDQVATMKQVMRKALLNARTQMGDLSYLELHGEGSLLRDAVELRSVKELWEEGGSARRSCPIGSVKANIGHLLLASGIAGFIKACLISSHRTVPRHPRPSGIAPYAGLSGTPFHLADRTATWSDSERRHRIGVNASGIAGINCFVVCAEPPARIEKRSISPRPMNKRRFWIDSASAPARRERPESSRDLAPGDESSGSAREAVRRVLNRLQAGEVGLAGAREAISASFTPDRSASRPPRAREILQQLHTGGISLETAKEELKKIRSTEGPGI